MALKVSIGQAQALNGREAGLQATHHALNRLGSSTPALGFVIAAHQYQAREVVSGVSGLLGDTPMIGFSSSACLSSSGLHHNSVMVALLAGDFQAETRWMPGYAQSGRETGAQLSRQAAEQNDPRALFFFAVSAFTTGEAGLTSSLAFFLFFCASVIWGKSIPISTRTRSMRTCSSRSRPPPDSISKWM